MFRSAQGVLELLCIVVVTMSVYSKGDGCTPAATRPEMCAMATMKNAPTWPLSGGSCNGAAAGLCCLAP